MATADVMIPNPKNILLRSLTFGSVLVEAAPSAAATKDPQSANTRFTLNNSAFIDLQLYLKAAQKLPKDQTDFEAEFPTAAFTAYLGTDGTFEKLRAIPSGADGIHKHCVDFRTTILVDMRTFCGNLVSFSLSVKRSSAVINEHLHLLTDPTTPILNTSNPKVNDALVAIFGVCDDLKAGANTTRDEADRLAKALEVSKGVTGKDAEKLHAVANVALQKLPDWQQMKKSTWPEIEEAIARLKKLFWEQVEVNRSRGFPQSGMLYTSVIGYTAYVSDSDMLDKLKALDKEVSDLFSSIEGNAAAALKLKSKATELTNMVKGVETTILAAIRALDNITGVFSIFKSSMDDILNKLGTVGGQLNHKYSIARRAAMGTFASVAATWDEVYQAAKFYQENGVLLDRESPSPQIPAVFGSSSDFEIVGASFGSQDVTTVARIIDLFFKEEQIEIPGLIREFGDPWPAVEKVYNMMYKTNKQYRIFLAYEYAEKEGFKYVLRKNPEKKYIGGSSMVKEDSLVAEDGNLGSSSKVDILGVVWGLEIVKKKDVYDCISTAAETTGIIDRTNANMGGNTWNGTLKSGTIFL